jgi:hypothetical protein
MFEINYLELLNWVLIPKHVFHVRRITIHIDCKPLNEAILDIKFSIFDNIKNV